MRRFVLTVSRLRCSSSAICWLLAGVAKLPPSRSGRHSATSTRRWVLGQAWQRGSLAGDHGGVGRGRLAEVVGEHRAPDPDQVPVLQALAPEHPLAVEEGAVPRQAVVDDRPFAAEALELGVQRPIPLRPRGSRRSPRRGGRSCGCPPRARARTAPARPPRHAGPGTAAGCGGPPAGPSAPSAPANAGRGDRSAAEVEAAATRPQG